MKNNRVSSSVSRSVLLALLVGGALGLAACNRQSGSTPSTQARRRPVSRWEFHV